MVNIIIGAIIFGYAAYTLVHFVKRSKRENAPHVL